jgi:hypothetical protein
MSSLFIVLTLSSGNLHLRVAGYLAASDTDTTRRAASDSSPGPTLDRLQHAHQLSIQVLMSLR